MTHPYVRLGRAELRRPTLILFGAWLLLTPILVWAAPGRSDFTIPDLAVAGSVEAAAEILSHWSDSDRLAFAFILGFDLLYDLVHNNAMALLVAWVAIGHHKLIAGAGSLLCWWLWFATVANFVENLGFLHILLVGPESPWPELGLATTILRNGAMLAGLGFCLLVGPGMSLIRWMRAHAA
jgi:hypothetical protein